MMVKSSTGNSFHYARIEKSKRLQRVLELLRQRGRTGATGREINHLCDVLNPGGACSELARNGFTIACKFIGTSDAGRKVYRYSLRGRNKFLKEKP